MPRPEEPIDRGVLLDQHQGLRAALGRLEEATAGTPETDRVGAWLGRMALDLDELQARLAGHFAHEERSGLFQSIRDARPEASPTCDRLLAEHEGFLARLARLREEARSGGEAQACDALRARVRTLIEELARHEETENGLMVDSLDGAVSAQD